MGYIVHFADLSSFDRVQGFREACRYAKAGSRDHHGAAVYEDKGAYHGACLRAWDDRGRRINVGNEGAREMGSRGGKVSSAALTPEQRQARARKAVAARWATCRGVSPDAITRCSLARGHDGQHRDGGLSWDQ